MGKKAKKPRNRSATAPQFSRPSLQSRFNSHLFTRRSGRVAAVPSPPKCDKVAAGGQAPATDQGADDRRRWTKARSTATAPKPNLVSALGSRLSSASTRATCAGVSRFDQRRRISATVFPSSSGIRHWRRAGALSLASPVLTVAASRVGRRGSAPPNSEPCSSTLCRLRAILWGGTYEDSGWSGAECSNLKISSCTRPLEAMALPP